MKTLTNHERSANMELAGDRNVIKKFQCQQLFAVLHITCCDPVVTNGIVSMKLGPEQTESQSLWRNMCIKDEWRFFLS